MINIINAAQESSPVTVAEALDRVLEILRTTELYSPQLASKEDDPHTNDLVGGLMSVRGTVYTQCRLFKEQRTNKAHMTYCLCYPQNRKCLDLGLKKVKTTILCSFVSFFLRKLGLKFGCTGITCEIGQQCKNYIELSHMAKTLFVVVSLCANCCRRFLYDGKPLNDLWHTLKWQCLSTL